MTTQRKFNKETVISLTEGFLQGGVFSIDSIVSMYLGEPRTELAKRLWRQRAEGWISRCKSKLRKMNEFLSIVEETDEGKFYGLVNTPEGAKLAFHKYYRFAKGVLNSVAILHKTVQSKKLLKGEVRNMPIYLPKVRGEK